MSVVTKINEGDPNTRLARFTVAIGNTANYDVTQPPHNWFDPAALLLVKQGLPDNEMEYLYFDGIPAGDTTMLQLVKSFTCTALQASAVNSPPGSAVESDGLIHGISASGQVGLPFLPTPLRQLKQQTTNQASYEDIETESVFGIPVVMLNVQLADSFTLGGPAQALYLDQANQQAILDALVESVNNTRVLRAHFGI